MVCQGRQVAILMYHHINDFYTAKGNISTNLFIQHLNMLQKEGYQVISVDSYAKFLEGKGDIPKKSAIITFDDGYESFYKYAYPELSKRHLPATNFVIVGLVGKTNGNLHYLTWAEMKKMQQHEMTFYPHTYMSHHYTRIYPNSKLKPCITGRVWLPDKKRFETESEYVNRVADDLLRAKEIMQSELGRPMSVLAWSYGQDSLESFKTASQLGYKFFYYVDNRFFNEKSNCFCIPRYNAGSMENTAQILESRLKIYSFSMFPEPARSKTI